jgi:hypothetical protein
MITEAGNDLLKWEKMKVMWIDKTVYANNFPVYTSS